MSIQSFTRRRYSAIVFTVFSFLFLSYFFIDLNEPKGKTDTDRIRNLLSTAESKSFCSERSVRRGFNQHVLSVSAYESNDRIELKTNLTWNYIKEFVSEAKRFYPTWVVRVYYYNLKDKTQNDIETLEKLNDNLDFCNAENLPVLGNLKNKLPGKVQRFLPAVDPLVGVTMVRDLDSEIFEREVQAVNEWLSKTTYAFHILRDHYMHGIPMLGGMWGIASNRLSINDRLTIANALLPSDNENDIQRFLKAYSGSGDQLFLEHHIWPLARQNSIAHDSFFCLWSYYVYRTDTRPFPSKREHPTCFVGCPKPCCTTEMKSTIDLSRYKKCPSMCRPKEHQDWLFC
ncbi:unnamed protein product [Adineta steineri]|uniref:Uncharacterized protein n=1 Tax=Adineta steineri TaxID=433720 RepID=A0A818M7Z1_9BILA|nr:unnamed protein product [Adineta steineri]CAF3583940.1 unnamed protein product [Adineta steineri]